jgi:hypothetical protein
MPKKPRKKPGSQPERLKVDGGWQRAVKKALSKGKPPKTMGRKDAVPKSVP